MPAVTTVVAALGAAAAIGGTVHAVESTAQAKRDAEGEAGRQRAALAQAESQRRDQEVKTEKQKEMQNTRVKQRAIGPKYGGRAGTMLSGPLGAASLASITGSKTLLGQ